MASIYTHDYFGRKLQKNCSNKSWTQSKLFLFGQQGPDLFFFHLGLIFLKKNPGNFIHKNICADYIMRNLPYLRKLDRESAAYGYFMGTIGHFILDAHIHPVVDKLESKDYLHMEIESELDRYYMLKEGIDPNTFPLSRVLPPRNEAQKVAAAITPFYQTYGLDENQVYSSLLGFHRLKDLFYTGGVAKEKRIRGILNLLGLNHYAGQMIYQKPHEKAEISNYLLSDALEIAFALAPDLLENVEEYIQGKVELDDFFYKDYNGKK